MRPADRAEAIRRTSPHTSSLVDTMSRITVPTAPVAPTMARGVVGSVIGRSLRTRRPARSPSPSSNASWVALTATLTSFSSTTTEIRISDVEIISMLTPASASAPKNVALTPGLDRIPAPTREILPIRSS